MTVNKIAVLVSGTGRSLENLAERIEDGRLDVALGLVLSDRPGVLALERAERLGVPHAVVARKDFDDAASFSRAVFREIEDAGCTLVVLAGFLRLLPIPDAWRGRVINIHPSLLPDFGGKGFYGDRVHAAVLAAGVAQSGCTVHFVDNQYDTGPHILQRRVDVRPDDDVHTLAARVFEEEKQALPEAITAVLSGAARLDA